MKEEDRIGDLEMNTENNEINETNDVNETKGVNGTENVSGTKDVGGTGNVSETKGLEEIETVQEAETEENFEVIDYDIDDGLNIDEAKNMSLENGKKSKKKNKEKEPFSWKKELLSWVKMIATAVILAFIITRFIIINANVPTESMENTIPKQSRIMGLRLTYLFSEPKRGDVVVFEYQFEEDTNYVKRIIGLPGETVYIKNGTIEIYKNGEYVETLKEDYLKEEWVWNKDGYTFEVPDGKYLVLGDNRNNSKDARYWYDNYYKASSNSDGVPQCKYEDIFVDEDAILGKVYFTYWPHFSFVND